MNGKTHLKPSPQALHQDTYLNPPDPLAGATSDVPAQGFIAQLLRMSSICLVFLGISVPGAFQEQGLLAAVSSEAQAQPPTGTGKLRIYDVPAPREEMTQDPAEQEAFLKINQSIDPTERTNLIEAFVQEYPDSNYLAQVHHTATMDYQRLNNPEKVFEHGRKTLEYSPDNIPVLALMALAHSSKGEPDRSIELATRALGRLQKMVRPANIDKKVWDADYRHYMAQSLAGLGHAYLVKYEIERQALREAAEQSATSPGQGGPGMDEPRGPSPGGAAISPSKLASLHLARAYGYLTKSLKSEPRSQFVHFQLGVVSTRLKRFPQAMSAFARAASLDGNYQQISRQNLESLYKSTHQNSLEGLQDLLTRAQEEISQKNGEPDPTSEDRSQGRVGVIRFQVP